MKKGGLGNYKIQNKTMKVKEELNCNPILESLAEIWDNEEDERWNNC